MELREEHLCHVREGAARLKCARKSQGLSVAKACAILGIAPATLKRWEAGAGTPGVSAIEKILDDWGLPDVSPLRTERRSENLGRKISWSVEQCEPRPVLRLLRHKRRRNHLGLEEISDATGVGVASLQRYETGQRIPNENLLESIAAAVGCTSEESSLLHQALASSEPTSVPFEVTEIFSKPKFNPGFWIFRELDFLCRFHQQQSADEVDNRLRSVFIGLAFTGDYSALLEAWQVSRNFARPARGVNAVQGMLAMAKMHLARRPKEALNEFVSIRKQIPVAPSTTDQINTTFSAIRMAQLVGEYEDADDLLTRVEHHYYGPSGRVSCQVYRHLIDYNVGEATDSIAGLQAIRDDAGPVLSYTTLVAELSIQAKMGRKAEALDILRQCGEAERTYSLGSPLARRIGATLLAAS